MTQTLINKQVVPETVTGFIEKLEALPRYDISELTEFRKGYFVDLYALRAIIGDNE